MPKRDDVSGSELDIILDDKSIRNPFYLFFPFLPSSDLERVTANHKIRGRRGYHIMVHPHLIEKEGLTDIPDKIAHKMSNFNR